MPPQAPSLAAGAAPLDRGDLVRHREWVRALARGLVRDTASADDLAQDALAAALERAPREEGHLRAWLARVVRNLAIQRHRSETRRAAREADVARSAVASDPTAMIAQAEAHRALVDHVLALSEPHRVVLLQRYFAGLTPKAIAEQEGCSVASISSRLTRAHAALRRRLEDHGGERQWTSIVAALVLPERKALASPSFGGAVLASAGGVIAVAAAVAAIGVAVWLALERVPADRVDMPVTAERDVERPAPALAAVPETTATRDQRQDVSDPVTDAFMRSVMTRGASGPTLHATVLDQDGAPVPRPDLRFESTEGKTATFTCNAEGHVLLTGLERDVDHDVFVVIGGASTAEPVDTVRFEGDTDLVRVWTVNTRARIVGVTVDPSGAAVGGQLVQLGRRSSLQPGFATSMRSNDGFATSDSNGEFVIEDVGPGRYGLAPASDYPGPSRFVRMYTAAGEPYDSRRKKPVDPGSPFVTPVEVRPGDTEHRVVVTIHRELFIDGRVVANGDEPVPKLTLHAWLDGASGALSDATDDEGRFRIGPLPPGAYQIEQGLTPDGWVLPEPARAHAGDTNVEVHVVRSASLAGSVMGDVDLEGDARGLLWLTRDHSSSRSGFSHGLQLGRGESTFRIFGVVPGTYTLSYQSSDHRHQALMTGFVLAPGDALEGVEVTPRPAARLEVRNPSRLRARVTVSVGPSIFHRRPVEPDSTSTFAVPPGDLEIVGERFDAGRPVGTPARTRIDARAGERATIDVTEK